MFFFRAWWALQALNGSDALFSWPHAAMMASGAAPFLIYWLDARQQAAKHHAEALEQQRQMHQENLLRLTKIDTQLKPIVDWWNRERTEERSGRRE